MSKKNKKVAKNIMPTIMGIPIAKKIICNDCNKGYYEGFEFMTHITTGNCHKAAT